MAIDLAKSKSSKDESTNITYSKIADKLDSSGVDLKLFLESLDKRFCEIVKSG